MKIQSTNDPPDPCTLNPAPSHYLPARMLNEFTYCPRLFYYEHVEGVFVHNKETIEGEIQHKRVDGREDGLPSAEELVEAQGKLTARSVMLSSDELGVVAKIDLVEARDGRVTPVDYKRGRPRKTEDGEIEAWDADQIQLAVQALVLRQHGYTCEEAIVYYAATKQRVRVPIDEDLVARTIDTVRAARQATTEPIPPPLVDSPKCPRCSLVGVCLPDETAHCEGAEASTGNVQQWLFDIGPVPHASPRSNDKSKGVEIRRLVPARDDLRPLYLNQQGLHVGKSGEVLKIKERGKLIQEVRLREICQLNVMGNVQLSTQAIQAACEAEVPIAYFSYGGWFYGVTAGLGVRNIYLRREQFRWADVPSFCLRLAKELVRGKIKNQRTLLQRNHIEPPRGALAQIRAIGDQIDEAKQPGELLGLEGNAARIYFENLSGMIKVGSAHEAGGVEASMGEVSSKTSGGVTFSFDFTSRNRRPPRDPINALLSLAYSLLAKDLTIVCHTVGFDSFLGYFHQPRFGRAALALDLMEPFRPLIADSAVLTAINTRMITARHFVRAGDAVSLTPEGRKGFFRAYEQRMDTLVTHPMFGYRVSYRRVLEIQARLLARVLTGELLNYSAFTTR